MELPDNVVDAAAVMAARMTVMTSRSHTEDGLVFDNYGEDTDDFEWDAVIDHFLSLLGSETSRYRVGRVLQCDASLDLPVRVVKATYERLIEMGATDATTRFRYAQYLKMHGPEWDDVTHSIISEVEDLVQAAGLLDGASGHHPVFYSDSPETG